MFPVSHLVSNLVSTGFLYIHLIIFTEFYSPNAAGPTWFRNRLISFSNVFNEVIGCVSIN